MEEKKIIAWLIAKDKRAIEYLYDRYGNALYGMVLRIVHSETLAQDIVQEAFVKIWQHGEKYDEQKASLFTWMVQITRNTALTFMHSKAYRESLKRDSLNTFDHLNGNTTLIQQINVNKIGLNGLISQLEEKYRTIIDLIYFQGYTQQEVEVFLGIPLGTVKSRLKIALRELRKAFDQNSLTLLAYSLFFII
ncbi:MAG: sigma-70 family RNA polymerase sigma factor [Saprospiraceae bacterium]|nr:sigma-70 family RNA polymerase sigma factor [Saprospiraceae bacterium]